MDLSREMTLADFSGRIGKIFNVHVAGQMVPLRLDALQELPGSKREGAPSGSNSRPLNPKLGQGVFRS